MIPDDVLEEWDANGWFIVHDTRPGKGLPTLPYQYPHPWQYPPTSTIIYVGPCTCPQNGLHDARCICRAPQL